MKSLKLLVSGFLFIILGALVCAFSFIFMGLNFSSLNTAVYVSRTYGVDADFDNISIDGDTEKINFALSDDGSCYVVCNELENESHEVKVEGDTLHIDIRSDFKFHFGFNTGSPEMNIYLPKKNYSSLIIDSDTGHIEIPEDLSFAELNVDLDSGSISCSADVSKNASIRTDTGKMILSGMNPDSLTLSTDTGYISVSDVNCAGKLDIRVHTSKVELNNINCAELYTSGDTGKLLMTNVVTAGRWDIKRSTGDISFDSCDAADIFIETDTGDVAGSFLSDKIFNVSTDTGKVNIPSSASGGGCDVRTDTGAISISILR